MFDAYTIKKVLPRLFIAAILIQLSWEIFTLSIDLTNRIAWGIEGLIYTPFGGKEQLSFSNIVTLAGGGGAGIFAAMVIGGGVAAGFAAVNIGVVLSFALTALIGLLIGFAFLLFRQVLVVALLIVSPIALVAWVLPNTEKLWKIWWESFSKLLLVYPLILIMIAVGRVFAWVAAGVDPGGQEQNLFEAAGVNDVITLAIIVIGYFGPFFLIPKTFQVAGSAFGNITGMVNDRSRGVFDRLRKGRQQSMANTWQQTRSGNRFQGGTPHNLRGRLNRGLEVAGNINKAGLNPRYMRRKMQEALRTNANMDSAKWAQESAAFQAFNKDDDKLWAARYHDRQSIANALAERDAGRFGFAVDGEDPNATRDRAAARNAAVEQILSAQRETSDETFARARVKAQFSTGTGYQYTDENGETQIDTAALLEDVNEAYGADRAGAGAALGEAKNAMLNSGQVAFGAAAYGTIAGQLENLYRTRGGSEEERQEAHNAAHRAIVDSAAQSATPGQAIYGKPASARALGESHARRVQEIVNGIHTGEYSQRDLDQALASTMGLNDAMSQASPQNAREHANALMHATITDPVNGGQISVYDLANSQSTIHNPAYMEMRRDFRSRAEEDAERYRSAPGLENPAIGGPPGGPPPGPTV